jgi:hypothetical protein
LKEEAHRRFGDEFNKHYYEHRRGTDIRWENIKTLVLLFEKLKAVKEVFVLKEKAVITLILQYLPIVEGAFSSEINFLIFTLISNGHDFYVSGEYVEFLTSIEKSLLQKIQLYNRNIII